MIQLPIVVVGAGVSGLCAVKACLEENLPVICYESSDSFGGIWQFKEKGMSVSEGTFLNSSKEWSCFSDFPAPPHYPMFLTHRKYLQYLSTFVDHFQIDKHIQFNIRVLKINKGQNYDVNGHWKITIQHQRDNSEEEVEASAVIVCAGVYHQQKMPSVHGLWDQFRGEVILSKDYKRPDSFRDKNVVVIGSGNTAFDAAVEVGKVANKVYLSLAHNGVLASRLDSKGFPVDYMYRRIWAIALNYLFKFNLLNCKLVRPFLKMILSDPGYAKLFNLQAGDNFFTCPIVINDDIPYRIACGQVIAKNRAVRFTPTSVIFEHEEPDEYPVDTVLVAAGFDQTPKHLFDENVLNCDQLINGCYQQVFPVHLLKPHCTLALIGNIKANGAAAPMIEMQARWVAQIFSGKAKLPPSNKIEAQLNELRLFKKKCDIPSTSLNTLGFYPYTDQVASEIGLKPNLTRLFFTDTRLWWYLLCEQFLSAQFRLAGPHAHPNARQMILTYKQRLFAPFKTRPKQPTNLRTFHKNIYVLYVILLIFTLIYVIF